MNTNIYSFSLLDFNDIPWEIINGSPDHNVFKSKEWFEFLKKAKNAMPFIIRIEKQSEIVGFLLSIKINKWGIKIVASPFEGYTTWFQGISFIKECSIDEKFIVYNSLIEFLFNKNHCWVFQARDFSLYNISLPEGGIFENKNALILDLTKDIKEIYNKFSYSSCKYSIRKAQKLGVIIQEPKNLNEFVNNYYSQLLDVFSKQNLKPTYSIKRVETLVEELYPSGQLLLLEARSPEGNCIATGIFPGVNKLANFWGGASYREFQYLNPNEPLIFEAIKIWKSRGIEKFEFGGGGNYKKKFGPEINQYVKAVAYKYPILRSFKQIAKGLFYNSRRFKAMIINWKNRLIKFYFVIPAKS